MRLRLSVLAPETAYMGQLRGQTRIRSRSAAGPGWHSLQHGGTALCTLGTARAQLHTALLGAATAAVYAETGHSDAEVFSCGIKAHAVALAHQVAEQSGLLCGAEVYQAGHPVAKAQRDIAWLLRADGHGDELHRRLGRHHLGQAGVRR
ncbi:hypothetical protein [Crossiella sp. S99.1]|uniref:hypothetical protein n=2 Tax=unclassified Crossiella TaxID=2620835 RepID=UPI001FFE68A6|nr:hypothetical protein [Crossiella sp. S99.1]MCK2240936.1 hypothetical protein [Crossiella sp. S99.2]MCK2253920.1 hypothetical protein [Crossiella sp. S99.1]